MELRALLQQALQVLPGLWRPLAPSSVQEWSVQMPQTQLLQAAQKSECSSTCVCLQKHGKKAAAVVVRLGIDDIAKCVVDSAAPSTYTGLLLKSLARSARTITMAAPPSVSKQQSLTPNGSEIILEPM